MKYLITSLFLYTSLSAVKAQDYRDVAFIRNANVVYSSRIETNANGDTVLVSQLKTENKSQLEFIKVNKGTPYFKNKWFTGEIPLQNGKSIKGNIAFDLVNNVVHFTPLHLDKTTEIHPKMIVLDDHVLRKENETYTNAMNYYYETVYDEKSVVLSRPVCRYRPKSYAQKTGYELKGDGMEGYFEKSEDLFLASGNKLVLIRTNAKFYDMFDGYKEAIQNYVCENKLDISSKPDILKAIRYYDSINIEQ
jgi:hypothetical protein